MNKLLYNGIDELEWQELCDIGAIQGSKQPKDLFIKPSRHALACGLVRIKPSYGMMNLEMRYI